MKIMLFLVIIYPISLMSQTWEFKAPYPALGRDDGIAFSINSFGYCVTGNTGSYAESNFLYKYNPTEDSWTKKAEFPGEARQYCTVFTIQNKAYLIGGYSKSGNGLSEVWCYDADQDQWTEKSSFAGGIRWGAFSFVIADIGYFGCGTDQDSIYSDFWQYDPKIDHWKQLQDFGGGPRREAVGCAAAGFGMAGLGFETFTIDGFLNDWYIFNPTNKQWEKSTDYPGGNIAYGKAETNGNRAIVGSGMNQNQVFSDAFYEFSPIVKTWKALPNIPTGPIRGSASFSIENKVYFTTGLTKLFERTNSLTALNFADEDLTALVFPNPSRGIFHLSCNSGSGNLLIQIYSAQGALIEEQETTSKLLEFSDLKPGLYFLKITNNKGKSITKHIVLS